MRLQVDAIQKDIYNKCFYKEEDESTLAVIAW